MAAEAPRPRPPRSILQRRPSAPHTHQPTASPSPPSLSPSGGGGSRATSRSQATGKPMKPTRRAAKVILEENEPAGNHPGRHATCARATGDFPPFLRARRNCPGCGAAPSRPSAHARRPPARRGKGEVAGLRRGRRFYLERRGGGGRSLWTASPPRRRALSCRSRGRTGARPPAAAFPRPSTRALASWRFACHHSATHTPAGRPMRSTASQKSPRMPRGVLPRAQLGSRLAGSDRDGDRVKRNVDLLTGTYACVAPGADTCA